jgi:hypothetical protein
MIRQSGLPQNREELVKLYEAATGKTWQQRERREELSPSVDAARWMTWEDLQRMERLQNQQRRFEAADSMQRVEQAQADYDEAQRKYNADEASWQERNRAYQQSLEARREFFRQQGSDPQTTTVDGIDYGNPDQWSQQLISGRTTFLEGFAPDMPLANVRTTEQGQVSVTTRAAQEMDAIMGMEGGTSYVETYINTAVSGTPTNQQVRAAENSSERLVRYVIKNSGDPSLDERRRQRLAEMGYTPERAVAELNSIADLAGGNAAIRAQQLSTAERQERQFDIAVDQFEANLGIQEAQLGLDRERLDWEKLATIMGYEMQLRLAAMASDSQITGERMKALSEVTKTIGGLLEPYYEQAATESNPVEYFNRVFADQGVFSANNQLFQALAELSGVPVSVLQQVEERGMFGNLLYGFGLLRSPFKSEGQRTVLGATNTDVQGQATQMLADTLTPEQQRNLEDLGLLSPTQ